MMEANPQSSRPPIAVVLSTCPPGDAEALAASLVEGRHAACVNIVPGVTSLYRWQGAVERSPECLLVIKCPRDAVERLIAALKAAHPYEVPEALALDVIAGHPPYAAWVLESCSGGSPAQKPGTGGEHGA